jgi:hypothetical protein
MCEEEKLLKDFHFTRRFRHNKISLSRQPYCIECSRGYSRSRRNKYEANRKWKKENPIKNLVNKKVLREIKAGRLNREPCEICGDTKSHAHHEDYSKPLDIIWLCPFHHKWIHK